MRITALIENTSHRPEISAEHGLSLHIEANGKTILFDMGQSDLFHKNAEILNLDLKAVDFAVVSHGHYDHGGGLEHFMHINRHAPVYISRYAFGAYYNGTDKYIGLDPALAGDSRLQFTENKYSITDGITLYHDTVITTDFKSNDNLTVKQGEIRTADDFRHEQYLLIEENGKRVLFSGCSHRGIERIVKNFQPDLLIGGFHFSKLPPESLADVTGFLAQQNTEYYTCHCTGTEQFAWMQKRMERLHHLAAGEQVTI